MIGRLFIQTVCKRYGLQTRAHVFSLLLAAMMQFFSGSVFADFCDTVILQRADKNPELAYRPFPNRCEGFYSAETAASALKIVGLTTGPFVYQMDQTEVVTISLPRHGGQTLRIRAEAIPNKTYYRMDAELTAGQELQWPMQDVVAKRPGELTSDKIGLLAWKKEGGDMVFCPVRALSRKIVAGRNQNLHLIISPSEDYMTFKWRTIKTTVNGAKTPGEWMDPLEKGAPIRMGCPITILLAPETTGVLYVEVAARLKNTEIWIKNFLKLDLGQKSTTP